MKIFQTVILGGGISGLSCAYNLNKKGITDFVVITKELGGRISLSENQEVNYGAYYVRSDYEHVLPFVTLKRKISNRNILIFNDQSFRTIKQIIQENWYPLIRLLIPIVIFKIKFKRFRRESQFRSQKEVIESDQTLYDLYKKPAEEYIKEKKLQHLFSAIEAMARLNGFTEIKYASAFLALEYALGLFYPIFEYKFNLNELIADFHERIILKEVQSIRREKDLWFIKIASQEEIGCKYLISGLPINISNKLLKLHLEMNKELYAYVFHLTGFLKLEYEAQSIIAFSKGEVIGILTQMDGSFILYSLSNKVDFNKYFTNYQLIAEKYWNPALFTGSNLIESTQKDNLFLIGDHNIPGLEDSFITGMYASEQIINRIK